ncbi:cytochrome c and c1 heme-lyase [Meredithblackwellia eburnea MCA 4105]
MWPFTSTPATKTAPSNEASACPVDHTTRQAWLDQHKGQDNPHSPPSVGHPSPEQFLSKQREVSSIPRWLPSEQSTSSPSETPADPTACPARSASTSSSTSDAAGAKAQRENWVYPSPSSFFTALQRKNRDPDAKDMPVVVPIHNAVNERAWSQILEWERVAARSAGRDEELAAREASLVNFVGRPKDWSPRARWKSLIGYSPPFDRHDWIVDRPGPTPSSPSTRIRYVIDFYTGHHPLLSSSSTSNGAGSENNFRPNLSFFLDVRPALDDWEGFRMRGVRYWGWGLGKKETPAIGVAQPAAGQQ